jgi:hypothetical protein
LSQLTYANSTGQSGEFFARVDTPWRVFVKGYIGSGALNGGKTTDEDWGNATTALTGFQVTSSTQSGWLNYAAADVGYDMLHDSHYKLGPFVGYSYFRQNVNASGCNASISVGQVCNGGPNGLPVGPNDGFLAEDETWQSLRVGVSAVARIWDRWGIDGDVAYLPYGRYSGLDTHPQRDPVAFFPQNGTSRGVQAELILTYLLTDSFELASADATGPCGPQAAARTALAAVIRL